jgi:type VI secretion system secreted protein Hcp
MAVNFYLQIQGIDGESKSTKFTNQCQLISWSFGAQQTGTSKSGGGAAAGKVQMEDFNFTITNGKHTPKVFLALCKGDHIAQAILSCCKSGGGQAEQAYLIYTFTDLLISSVTTSGASSSDDLPTDHISFNFSQIKVDYKEQDKGGNLMGAISSCFNLKTMTPC